mmetsp:Transcript_24989/g.53217  ORF Transcript_24989/g.53217 Transcript_24989/m.53217 type:complete len:88 (+) Transcript_24989:1037-1300(+)
MVVVVAVGGGGYDNYRQHSRRMILSCWPFLSVFLAVAKEAAVDLDSLGRSLRTMVVSYQFLPALLSLAAELAVTEMVENGSIDGWQS